MWVWINTILYYHFFIYANVCHMINGYILRTEKTLCKFKILVLTSVYLIDNFNSPF